MKGTFFQKPFEFSVKIEGESWKQADTIQGTLTIKNHGNEPISVADAAVHLGYGTLKKVHAKKPDAFDLLDSLKLPGGGTLAAGSNHTENWQFKTDRNVPITDSTDSLFILYGMGDQPEKLGQIQLVVQPYWVIQEFVSTLTTQFRFVLKALKSNKGRVEAKLAPPDGKAFAMLDQLMAYFHFEGEGLSDLKVTYSFQIKKIEASAATVDVKKAKKENQQVLSQAQYLTSSGRIHHDSLEKSFREALTTCLAWVDTP